VVVVALAAAAVASAADSAVLPCAVATVARPVATRLEVVDTAAATVVVAVALVVVTNLTERTAVGSKNDHTPYYEVAATIAT
jgi:hypothetical protein